MIVVPTAAFGVEVSVPQRCHVMSWLDAGVPLTLVMDLLDETGPNSQEILNEERPASAQLQWLAAFALPPRR